MGTQAGRKRIVGALVAAWVAIAACSSTETPIVGSQDGASAEAGTAVCPAGRVACAAGCVDTTLDPTNCGGCNIACAAGESCVAGLCSLRSCGGGTTLCGDKCVDTKKDTSHCGACGKVCPFGRLCVDGACSTTCSGGTVACGEECINLNVDPNHCGSCGSPCTPGLVCFNGQCGLNCGGGTTKCGSRCVDTNLDPANCGVCSNVCPAGQVCSAGACALACSGDTTKCGAACVETSVDPANCGTCAKACAAGEVCSVGACGLSCGGGTQKCGTRCIDTNVDPAHCGSCATACAADNACVGGTCTPFCMGGLTRCGSACDDLRKDPANCGACGTACPAGSPCEASACRPPKSCKAILAANAGAPDGKYTIDPDGAGAGAPFDVYCDMTSNGGGWTLVMKLGAGDFCYGNANWTTSTPLNEAATLDTSFPGVGTYDAKSRAFYLVDDVKELRLATTLNTVSVTFATPSSPKVLMTTNTVPFAIYPDRAAWVAAFGHDRNEAPIFMRAGVPVTAGNTCRTNPASTPSGCGQLCMFCYQAADGNCCGCAATANDTNSGIGNNAAYCGGGLTNCSTAGTWSNTTTRTLVWAR